MLERGIWSKEGESSEYKQDRERKIQQRMGCTVHMAAAYVIARRGMGME